VEEKALSTGYISRLKERTSSTKGERGEDRLYRKKSFHRPGVEKKRLSATGLMLALPEEKKASADGPKKKEENK